MEKLKVFLVTPPFTQLNTPYPATAYLKGFLNTKNISSYQADLGIEVILKLFCNEGLQKLFAHINNHKSLELSSNSKRILLLQKKYIDCIDMVISFLQGKNPNVAFLIAEGKYLPQASRFNQIENIDFVFGEMAIQDKAKHLCTLFLEDLSDLIVECVDPFFGFSRYAERLGRSANTFDELHLTLQQPYTYIDELLIEILQEKFTSFQPQLVALSVPFPGNLYAAFRIGQWIKKHFPSVKIAMGGGFPNTELREISDSRVFKYIDFITLDDGESPIENILQFIADDQKITQLKRTFILLNGVVTYFDNHSCKEYSQAELGTPDYAQLLLNQYLSVVEIANPMHRLWSDGRWNKLTMAHGCYWGKCTFCDISLDYIQNYQPLTAALLCDRIEEIIAQTGELGFHFVDEAAPPALMRDLALEILKRKLQIVWWTNIRFEKSFSYDLCLLLKASGCIAISGGLEVASNRLLKLIDKGVTVEQVAKVCKNFTDAGILVHAYLMYGYPTQTAQETVDSLEMVRQMFESGILKSGFWHQFALTAHSPVSLQPEKFNIKIIEKPKPTFAHNDMEYIDLTGTKHAMFSYGLKKSLYNYMHQMCFDYPLQKWFDFKIPKTTVPNHFIKQCLGTQDINFVKPQSKIVWIGNHPEINFYTKHKRGQSWEMSKLIFHKTQSFKEIELKKVQAMWLINQLTRLQNQLYLFSSLKESFENECLEDFEPFWYSKSVQSLKSYGLLVL